MKALLSTNTTTFSLFIRSLKISFIIAWNIASESIILKNITVGLKEPIYVINTSFHSLSFLILMLLNLYYRSIFTNTFLLFILLIKSIINSNR